MITITATDARSNFFQLVKNALQGTPPVRIVSKKGNVIMLTEEEYESLIETAELLAEPGLKESIKKADKEIKNGEIYSFNQVFKN